MHCVNSDLLLVKLYTMEALHFIKLAPTAI